MLHLAAMQTLVCAAALGIFVLAWASCTVADTTLVEAEQETQQPSWSDEFDVDGAPDSTLWDYDLGDWGWGNHELQDYTRSPQNVRVENGHLIIEAHRKADTSEAFTAGTGRNETDDAYYSSARLVTRGRKTWNSGRIDIRARLPKGVGTWPAIWMLGENIADVGWPLCGEIDIMEQVGYDPDTIIATVHTQAFNHIIGNQHSSRTAVPDADSAFHVYSVKWLADTMKIGVDGEFYYAYAKPDTATQASWPFDNPHYLLLNLAVGGDWGGRNGVDPDIWPQRLEVDWVRAYN